MARSRVLRKRSHETFSTQLARAFSAGCVERFESLIHFDFIESLESIEFLDIMRGEAATH